VGWGGGGGDKGCVLLATVGNRQGNSGVADSADRRAGNCNETLYYSAKVKEHSQELRNTLPNRIGI